MMTILIRKWRAAAALAAAVLACATVSHAAARSARGVAVAPVLDSDFADPFVLPVGDGLFAYATNTDRGGRRLNVQVSRSADGVHWSAPADAMPAPPAWARAREPDIWAPEVLRIGARYVLYFSARHATRRRPDGLTLCIGAAVADRPGGPFVPQPAPLDCGGRDGVIDASPFRDASGLWLYTKSDGNCCGARTRVLARRLAPGGLDFLHAAMPLEGVSDDRAWEGRVIEGPQMVEHAGALTLFYAANDYTGGRYAFGYARCAAPEGPCRDARENPILASREGLVGPGHGHVFHWHGRDWLAVAAWRGAGGGQPRRRAMYVLGLDWVGARPVVRR